MRWPSADSPHGLLAKLGPKLDGARRAAVPGLIAVTGMVAAEIAYGVGLADALLYLVYELGFVVLPGWLAYVAVASRPGGALRRLAVGWALGYVLEILAFALTAATDTRPLFVLYPLAVAAGAVAIIARRHPAGAEESLRGRLPWAVVSLCLLGVAYIALSYFPGSPLPGTESVTYFIDYPRWIGLSADAMNHWPIMDPSVSGEPLPYHYFVNIHIAAAGQVTGLDLPLVFFRLFILPLTVLLVLELVVAGESIAGSARVGLIAAALVLLIGELRLDASQSFLAHTPFFGLLFTNIVRSPSFLFGLVLFVPLMILLGERLSARAGPQARDWLLVGLFMVGVSGAKISILPVVIAALCIYAGWTWLARRRVQTSVWVAGALAVIVCATVYFLQYSGHGSGLVVDPFSALDQMPAIALIKGDLAANVPAFPGKEAVLSVGGVVVGSLGLLAAQLVGLAWLLRHRGWRLPGRQIWPFSLLVAGLCLALTFSEPGTQSGLYFLFYGLVAGCVLSAEGLRIAWGSRPALDRSRTWHLAALAAAFGVVLVGLIGIPTWLDLFSGPRATAFDYMFRYGGLVLALILLYVAARRLFGPRRWIAGALVSGGILAVGALATPIDNLEPALTDPAAVKRNFGKSMTPDLYGALRWIRDETPTGSVIAVNNQWIDAADASPLEFIYSAFAERRVFLEGWGYSARSRELGYAEISAGANPFADRLLLNRAAFTGALGALQTLVEQYGVSYLVVDELNGYRADIEALTRHARIAYTAPGVLVLDLASL